MVGVSLTVVIAGAYRFEAYQIEAIGRLSDILQGMLVTWDLWGLKARAKTEADPRSQ
jgi:hypothetical protein